MIFSPIKIGSLEVSNRIVVAPMCQYSAINGVMTHWHTQHLMQLGCSAAGLIMVEATAVEKIGINEDEASIFAKELEKIGCHYVCVSS